MYIVVFALIKLVTHGKHCVRQFVLHVALNALLYGCRPIGVCWLSIRLEYKKMIFAVLKF